MPRLTDLHMPNFGMTTRWERQLEELLSTPPGRVSRMELCYNRERGTFPLVIEMADPYRRDDTPLAVPRDSYTFDLIPPLAEHHFGHAAVSSLRRGGGTRPVIYRGGRWEVSSVDNLSWEYVEGAVTGATPPVDPSRGAIDLPPEILESLPEEALALIRNLRRKVRTAERNAEDAQTRLTNAQSSADRSRRQMAQIREQTLDLQRQHERMARELLERDARLARLADVERTARVWRDHGTGAEAQLDAFKNFCEALDSLPAPQETPSPDFALAG